MNRILNFLEYFYPFPRLVPLLFELFPLNSAVNLKTVKSVTLASGIKGYPEKFDSFADFSKKKKKRVRYIL